MKDNYKIVDIINNGAIVTVYKIKKRFTILCFKKSKTIK